MKNHFIRLFILTVNLIFSIDTYGNTGINPWQNMTQNDLKLIHDTILENTPLEIKTAPPNYKNWLESGYLAALQRVPTIENFSGYIYDLRFYVNGFQDYHTKVVPLLKIMNPSEQWPGFIVAMRNEQYKVIFSSHATNIWQSLPPVGSTLLGCDGQTAEQLMRTNVLPYWGGNVTYPSTWQEVSTHLFTWDNNPWGTQFKTCSFSQAGTIHSYELHWVPVYNNTPLANMNPIDVNLMVETGAFGPIPEFGIHSIGKDGVWISIPIFAWGLAAQGSDTTQLLNGIANKMSELKNKRLIIFDVRGNTGGDPQYMRPILVNLYGENYLKSLGQAFAWNNANITQFRVSAGNLKNMITSKSPVSMIAQMQQAIAHHQTHMDYTTNAFSNSDDKIIAYVKPITAKVIVVTDGRCGSECTSFVKDLLSIPNTIQVGQPTAIVAASTWNRVIVFPDQAAALLFPTGMQLGSNQSFNKPLIPTYIYSGDMGNTKELQDWILQLFSQN